MVSRFNTLVVLVCLTIIAQEANAKRKKQYFNQQEFTVDFNITHPILTADFTGDTQHEILLIGEDAEKQRIMVLFGEDKIKKGYTEKKRINIPNRMLAFDLLTLANGKERVLLLDEKGLSSIDFETNSIIPLQEIHSIYLEPKPQFIMKKNLVQDVNGDGLDDIVITDFSQKHLLLQTKKGEFYQQSLPIKAKVNLTDSSISFYDSKLFSLDVNFDNKLDLVKIGDDRLEVYQQLENGRFSSISSQIPLNIHANALRWWEIRGADGETADQSHINHRMIESIEDINGDKIADLMVQQTQSSGVLDKNIHYDIYFGKNEAGYLRFDNKPDTSLDTEGTIANLKLLDTNADGRKEILVSTFDIGVSQIIGALLSGSIDQEVMLFSLSDDNRFSKKPLFSEDVDLKFSLSSGNTGEPVILAADLNGDGNKELVLSTSNKRLDIYNGKNDPSLFESRAKRHKIRLPRNGAMAIVSDLSNDKKQQIIVRYGKQDKPELRNKVIILSAK